MMGCLKSDQGQLFYEFHLNDAIPEDHLVRKIDAALDLSWLRGGLAPHYSSMGTGRRRCRMHGGADGTGAPEGSKNGNYKPQSIGLWLSRARHNRRTGQLWCRFALGLS